MYIFIVHKSYPKIKSAVLTLVRAIYQHKYFNCDIFTVMHLYFAAAPLKAYLFDILVWAIIGAIALITALTLFKRNRLLIVIFGVLVFLSAFPIAIMSELSINGCCGAPDTGHEGIGYIIGAAVAVIGILILAFSKKLSARPSSKSL